MKQKTKLFIVAALFLLLGAGIAIYLQVFAWTNPTASPPGGGSAIYYVSSTGNVGIGTTTPVYKLDVLGDTGFRWTDSAGAFADFRNNNNRGRLTLGGSGDAGTLLHTTGGWQWNTQLNIMNGNVGIGTTNPGAKLEVAGQVKITGGSPGADKVLTSDASGLASWGAGVPVPSGAVMFFNLTACPTGWEAVTAARGRYLVGLPSAGTLAGTIGTALSNLENRPVGKHTHTATQTPHSHTIPATDASDWSDGFRIGGYISGTRDSSAVSPNISVGSTGAVDDTNAPYLQLLVCQKN